eukprot:3119888-Rhodomonas_salina.3
MISSNRKDAVSLIASTAPASKNCDDVDPSISVQNKHAAANTLNSTTASTRSYREGMLYNTGGGFSALMQQASRSAGPRAIALVHKKLGRTTPRTARDEKANSD